MASHNPTLDRNGRFRSWRLAFNYFRSTSSLEDRWMMRSSVRISRALAVLCTLPALLACGTVGRPEAAGGSSGRSLDRESTTRATSSWADSRSSDRPGSATSPPESISTGASETALADSISSRPVNLAANTVYPFQVEMVTDGNLTFGHSSRFAIQVTLRNIGDVVHYYVADQGNFAAMTPVEKPQDVVWTSTKCNPTLGIYEQTGGAQPLDPGAEISAVVHYPRPSGGGSGCELPVGEYLLFGLFPVCPDDALVETANPGTYVCEEGSERLLDSGPLRIALEP